MPNRPSDKELTKKLWGARNLLGSVGYLAADPDRLLGFFTELSLFSDDEQNDALKAAFTEVTASDYRGRRPPEKSFEPATRDEELFAFVWDWTYFGRRMYLKFCMPIEDKKGKTLFLHSLHVDRPSQRGTR